MTDINRLRASRGLPVLEVRPNLTRKARQWATTMAAARKVWHSRISRGVTGSWQKLGENVGHGPSQPLLHAAFVASGSHLWNLVDPSFRYVGVGVVIVNGIIFVSQVFMQPWSRSDSRASRAARRPSAQRLTSMRPTPQPPTPPPSTGKRSALFRPAY
ncbi:MAG: CAP domain-containing protein [Actinomycetota bacterium]